MAVYPNAIAKILCLENDGFPELVKMGRMIVQTSVFDDRIAMRLSVYPIRRHNSPVHH